MLLFEIASNYLFIDIAIKNLTRDLKIIEQSPFKINEPYKKFTNSLIHKAIAERRRLKKEMMQHKIQVQFKHKQGDYVTYVFYLNGRVKEVTYHKNILKQNVKKIIIQLNST